MNKLRRISFAILIVAISSIVIFQAMQSYTLQVQKDQEQGSSFYERFNKTGCVIVEPAQGQFMYSCTYASTNSTP